MTQPATLNDNYDAGILPNGATITYERTAPFTYAKSIVTTEIMGRNWYFEDFHSYTVRGGECVYPHQIRP